jgi:hypothetical protein
MDHAVAIDPTIRISHDERGCKQSREQENWALIHTLSIAMLTGLKPVNGRRKTPPSSHFQAL